MKTFVRIIALILACLSCLLTVVACDEDDDKNKEVVQVVVDANGVRWAEDEWGMMRIYDSLPTDLDYNDEVINVLCWNTNKAEFIQSEEVDDARLSSIYKRNSAVQDRLGVELNLIQETAGNGDNDPYAIRVMNTKSAGLHDYDILACYSRTAGTLLMNGLWKNLTSIEGSYIDLEQPWWPANIVSNLAINDSLYYVSGDVSVTAIDQMHVIFFNKDLINEHFEETAVAAGYTDGSTWLYSHVYNGTWTIDFFLSLLENTYEDRDRNNITTVSDRYGLCTGYRGIAAIYNGCNLRMIEQDPNQVLTLSSDFTSNRTTKLVAKVGEMMNSGNCWNDNHASNASVTGSGSAYRPFYTGNSFFLMGWMYDAENSLVGNDAITEYGILPYPKYDTNQKNYYTMLGNPFSIYGIYNDFDQRGDAEGTLKMLTAILECWGSEAYRKTTPVVFELGMQLKLSPTQYETDMCEYVRAGIMFDMGRIFPQILSGGAGQDGQATPDTQFAAACRTNTAWTTYYSKTLGSMQNYLKKFVNDLLTMPEYQ